jgi:hypothetical protein
MPWLPLRQFGGGCGMRALREFFSWATAIPSRSISSIPLPPHTMRTYRLITLTAVVFMASLNAAVTENIKPTRSTLLISKKKSAFAAADKIDRRTADYLEKKFKKIVPKRIKFAVSNFI